MFFFSSFHVLILYAWNRIAGILEFDEAVYEEIQKRASLVPPAQRQATIDAMVKDREAIGKQALRYKKMEEDAAKRRNRPYYVVFWFVVAIIIARYLGDH